MAACMLPDEILTILTRCFKKLSPQPIRKVTGSVEDSSEPMVDEHGFTIVVEGPPKIDFGNVKSADSSGWH